MAWRFRIPGQVELPREAIKLGIGMVHQHFMLVPTQTGLENLILANQIAGRGVLNLSLTEVSDRMSVMRLGRSLDA